MHDEGWLTCLEGLLVRYPYLGASHDVGSMTLMELWGLYCLLRRLSEVQP